MFLDDAEESVAGAYEMMTTKPEGPAPEWSRPPLKKAVPATAAPSQPVTLDRETLPELANNIVLAIMPEEADGEEFDKAVEIVLALLRAAEQRHE